jgi:hypothetical protein
MTKLRWRLASTYLSGLVYMARLDTHFATKRVNNSRAIRPNEPRFGLALEHVHDLRRVTTSRSRRQIMTNLDFIGLRDAFGNANNKPYFVFNSLDDSICSVWWWDVEN